MKKNSTGEHTDQNPPWGLLSCIDLYECNPELIRNKEKIKQFVSELDFITTNKDTVVNNAIEHLLLILGESTGNLFQ